MSGGIDSTVAAYLLKQQGHEVVGVTMTIWSNRSDLPKPKQANACFAPDKTEDLKKIKAICSKLGIEHQVLELSDQFEQMVLKSFTDEYISGRTPNPCVWCNSKIKFGSMVDYARAKGLKFDRFATGHYARIIQKNGRYAISRAADLKKDQSYFLYRLSQEQLATTLFPLGEMHKDEVRLIDQEQGFHSDYEQESQDFYGGDYSDLLEVSNKEGTIVDLEGNVLGRHEGIWHYTIGQRKGLGIAAEKPYYVLALRADTNEVVVGFFEQTYQASVTAKDLVWGFADHLAGEVSLQVKIRSTDIPEPIIARQNEDGTITATFASGAQAATLGQSMVLYDGDDILCGGIIERVG